MPRAALADDPEAPADGSVGNLPGASYLYDGGAIPFLWAPLAGRIAMDSYLAPRESPLMFSSEEGGAPRASWEIPGWGVSSLGGVTAAAMIAGGDGSRWYHVKGLAESLATGCLVTGAIKLAFGRHRPSWTPESRDGERRSFPSGHATQAFAIATYAILYLHGHYFDTRGSAALEYASYAGLALTAGALAGERVLHNRHHLSDVAVGGLLGIASSTAFYLYQDHRYRNQVAAARESQRLTVSPTASPGGFGIQLGFAW